MAGTRGGRSPWAMARRDRGARRFASALALSIAIHGGAFVVFSGIPALPEPGLLDTPVVELVAGAPGLSPLQDIPSQGESSQAEAPVRLAAPVSGETPESQPDHGPAVVATEGGGDQPGETPEVARLEEARASLEGQVASLRAERAELTARLAAEEKVTGSLEDRLRDVERQRAAELTAVRATYQRLVHALQGELAEKEVALRQASDKLSMSILDRVLFPSGEAALTPAGRRIMDKVSKVLAGIEEQRVTIEGHTDDVPIGAELRARFASNWELSTARATEVVRYLVTHGVPSGSLSATGRADTDPVASNDTAAGRQRNRRIEIILRPADDRPVTLHATGEP